MADPRTTIQHAFEKLKLSVSVDDAHKFASTELEDVWATLRDIEVKQRQRRSVQNLRRVEPLLRGIEKYRKVIEVLCNGTPYMPYVWGNQIASNHRDVFEALLSAYADIGAALPRILEFHQRAYKFLTRRGIMSPRDQTTWHLLFSSLWTDFGGRFECIIKSLKQQRDFVDKEAVSFHIVESKLSRCAIQDQLQRAQKKELDQLKDKEENTRQLHMKHSISWLSIDEKNQEIEYERTSRRRHLNTCEWITEDQLYRSWIKDDNLHLCLWLDGKPGSDIKTASQHIYARCE
ncbi:hypothetical protein M7I_2068 [Glarea lozoyensis 74030]|uniref:Nephrocystin 3-like N-terminal domain-containing protein n=1 Tax=Glarea lozoyensis (strain ATCC 74030 / MF5533) TaxID=1104152 RepID=H0EHT2_GLAL7|nr:hypothetical protein M7I_2068 [Glarea lozoyensis 74030]